MDEGCHLAGPQDVSRGGIFGMAPTVRTGRPGVRIPSGTRRFLVL
jgi:hypothetical protein